jgi:hypothetical protein
LLLTKSIAFLLYSCWCVITKTFSLSALVTIALFVSSLFLISSTSFFSRECYFLSVGCISCFSSA